MKKREFDKLRKPPSGRPGIFVLEAEIAKARRKQDAVKKIKDREQVDAFREKASKILPGQYGDRIDSFLARANRLMHFEELDPGILFIASILYDAYSDGYTIPGSSGRTLPLNIFSDPTINEAINSYLSINDLNKDRREAAIVDILAVYGMLYTTR